MGHVQILTTCAAPLKVHNKTKYMVYTPLRDLKEMFLYFLLIFKNWSSYGVVSTQVKFADLWVQYPLLHPLSLSPSVPHSLRPSLPLS